LRFAYPPYALRAYSSYDFMGFGGANDQSPD
jgi:hypothetical protein